jgi:hypothetical protein
MELKPREKEEIRALADASYEALVATAKELQHTRQLKHPKPRAVVTR